jgi:hypothetical protein
LNIRKDIQLDRSALALAVADTIDSDAGLVRAAIAIRNAPVATYTDDDIRCYAAGKRAADRLQLRPLPALIALDGSVLVP